MSSENQNSAAKTIGRPVWLAGPSLSHLRDGPVSLSCFDEDPIVLFDTSTGPACLSATCPHRQAFLGLGKVSDDCIVCPFHGWHFNSAAEVVKIPAHPEHKLGGRFKTDFVPAIQVDDWVFLKCLMSYRDGYLDFERIKNCESSDIAVFTPTSTAFFTLPSGVWHSVSGTYSWQANFSRVVANGIDFAHLPFVHPTQFGNSSEPTVQEFRCIEFPGGAAAEQLLLPPDNWQQLLLRTFVHKGQKRPVLGRISFLAPNMTKLELDLGAANKLIIFDANVPTSRHSTTTYWSVHRNFAISPLFDRAFIQETLAVFDCDRIVVESQRGAMPIFGTKELHVPSDALEIKYRHLLRSWLAASPDQQQG